MDEELKRDLNKMKTIMIIISIIIFIIYLLQAKITWKFELQAINSNATPSGSILGWIFVGCVFGIVYYACLCLIALIIWKIFNRNHPEANQSFTIVTKSGSRFIKPKPSKYDEQIEILVFHTIKYVCIIEATLITFMYMFGLIKIV